MPTKPKAVNLTENAADILNGIRNSASQNYKDYVPTANLSASSPKEIGAVIMSYPALQNEFLNALVNRIGKVLVTSKSYQNPWAFFKRGYLEYGETIEEIFVRLANPHTFDEATAVTNVFQREIPDVRSAFHILNYQKYYKVTIEEDRLRQAFLSWGGITELISYIVDSMLTGANYDEFQVMKYLLGKHILNGRLYAKSIDTVTAGNASKIVTTIKSVSNDLEFLKAKYNPTGVETKTLKNDQYVILNADFDATMDVNVLATAFNMNKAEFMGHRVLVDSFGDIDNDRLALLFEDDDTYTPLTTAELEALSAIPCVIVDKDFFMIFDNLTQFRQQENGEGLYWNYWYHVWKTFSVSPFANAVVFTPTTPAITSVTVSPATATVARGASTQLTATVVTTGFAPKTVKWTSADTTKATVDSNGLVTVKSTATAAQTVVITATSTYDSTKKGTCTITIS